MRWTKPDFQEITLNMEVTGYVNTDDEVEGARGEGRGTGDETKDKGVFARPSPLSPRPST